MERTVILTSLKDKPLQVIQNAKLPKEMWDSSNTRYEAASNANKIDLLTSLRYTRYQDGRDLGDYIAKRKTYFNRQAVIGLPVAEKMQVVILLVSVMNEDALKSAVAALRTADGEKATWDSVCFRLLEDRRSQQMMKGANTSDRSC